MNKQVINGIDFYQFLKYGADHVLKEQEHLNQINVFPVKDGDTGTNLLMTINAIVSETPCQEDFDVVIRSMSDVALENARGNSGLIFASFISGFFRACGQFKNLTLEQFCFGATMASKEAKQAVSEPVEGTMLSVIEAWANHLDTHQNHYHDFNGLLYSAYEASEKALLETPERLAILKQYKVVDSGAKGFVLFLKGVNQVLSGMKSTIKEYKETVTSSYELGREGEVELSAMNTQELNGRYCTEILIYAPDSEVKIIEAIALPFGDSLVIKGNDRLIKVHIHTHTPEVLVETLMKRGYVIHKSKVDDMLFQKSVDTHRRSRIAIVTDSIADIDEKLIFDEQIHVLPLSLVVDGNLLIDKMTAHQGNIEKILNQSKSYPTSTQLDMKQIHAKLNWLKGYYEEIIVLSVSKALSGTYQNYEKVVTAFQDEGYPITLIDSKLNAAAQGMVVLKAAELANAGYSRDQIVQDIEKMIPNMRIYVSLDTFKYAVKSGRVPNTIGNFLMKLNAKPIMSLDEEGRGKAFGLAFSRASIDKKIMNQVSKIHNKDGIKSYAIIHSNNEALAEKYAEIFESMLGQKPRYISGISAVTTVHAGIGSVAIAFEKGAHYDS